VATCLASPGLPWLDAGDFVTASATLGVPHPTGFPLYTLLSHTATLLPVGNLASRLSFLSALCAAIAAYFTISTLRFERLAQAVPAAIAVFFAFLCVPTLAVHSRVPEVYGLQLALTCAGLFCLERLWSTQDARFLSGLGLVCGLGLANHALFRGIAPVLLAAALPVSKVRRPRPYLRAGGLLLLGCSLYAYLPLAASRSGVHNWGDSSSWGRFWIHVNALEIREAFGYAIPATAGETFLEFQRFVGPLWDGLGASAWLGLLGLATAVFLVVRALVHGQNVSRLAGLGTVAGVLMGGETIYSVLINPMGNKDLQNGQMCGLFLPVVAAVWLLAVLERAVRWWRRDTLAKWAPSMAGALMLAMLVRGLDSESLQISQDFSCEDLAVASLGLAEPGAMTVLVSDSMAACHLYVQHALAARPDMAVFERNQLASGIRGPYALAHLPYPIVDGAFREAHSYPLDETRFAEQCRAIVDQNIDKRTIYWETSSNGDDLAPSGFTAEARWPIARLRRQESSLDDLPLDRHWTLPDGDAPWGRASRGLGSPAYRAYVAQQWSFMGRGLYTKGQVALAGRSFALAAELAPDSSSHLVNMAVCLSALGHMRQALNLAMSALELEPRNRTALSNAWRYATSLNDALAMERLMTRARQLQVSLPTS
jgi:hypothetical protein